MNPILRAGATWAIALPVILLATGYADEIKLTNGQLITDCKVVKLPDGRYEIRRSPTSAIRLSANDLDLASLVEKDTTWSDASSEKPVPPKPPPEDEKPTPTTPPAPTTPPVKPEVSSLDAFVAALKKSDELAANLRKKGLMLSSDSVYEVRKCSGCGGDGKVEREVWRSVNCLACNGRGQTLGAGGRVLRCYRCYGSGKVRVGDKVLEICERCDGTGLARGAEKGRASALAVVLPELEQISRSAEDVKEAALKVFHDEKVPKIPEDLFAAAMRAADIPHSFFPSTRTPFRVPEEKGLVFARVRVEAHLAQDKNTVIFFGTTDAVRTVGVGENPFRDDRGDVPERWGPRSPVRMMIRMPGNIHPDKYRSAVLRGFASGKEKDTLVLDSFQLWPNILKSNSE